MAEKRYRFGEDMVTAAELARRITCYSEPWLAEALRAGCRSVFDLAVRWYENGKRARRARAPSVKHRLRSFDTRRPRR
jgi:hypothetical protein